jgi:hypothetical protein
VTFKSDSQLSALETDAFGECSALSSILIPASLEGIFNGYGELVRVIGRDEK